MLRRDFLYGGLLLGVSLLAGTARAQPERTSSGGDGHRRSDPCATGNCGLEYGTRGARRGGIRSALNARLGSGRGRRGYRTRRYRSRRNRAGGRFRRRRFRFRRKRFRFARRRFR